MNVIVSMQNVSANMFPVNILMAAIGILAVSASTFEEVDDWKHRKTFINTNISDPTKKIEEYLDTIISACDVSEDNNSALVKSFREAISKSKDELNKQHNKCIAEMTEHIQIKTSDTSDCEDAAARRQAAGFQYVVAINEVLLKKLEIITDFMKETFSKDGKGLTITEQGIIEFMTPTANLSVKFKKSHHAALNEYTNGILPEASKLKDTILYGISCEEIANSGEDLMKNTRDMLKGVITQQPNKDKKVHTPTQHKYIKENLNHLQIIAENIAKEMNKTANLRQGAFSARPHAKDMGRIAQKQLQKSYDNRMPEYQVTDIFGVSLIAENLVDHESSLRNLATYFSTADNLVEMTTESKNGTKKTWSIGIQRVKKNIIMHDDDEKPLPDFTESFSYIDDKINFHVTEVGTNNTILIEHIGLLKGDYNLKKKSHAVYNFVRVLHESMANLLKDYCKNKVDNVLKTMRLVTGEQEAMQIDPTNVCRTRPRGRGFTGLNAFNNRLQEGMNATR